MPVRKLERYLDENRVPYMTIAHAPAYTAQEVAASAHVPGLELAKTVMVKIDGKLAMAVLPASYRVSIPMLRELTGAEDLVLATEPEFKKLFPDCELGAMPPFGNLWGLDVYVAEPLTRDREIVFSAGSHHELMKLAYEDFDRLVVPKVLEFAVANSRR